MSIPKHNEMYKQYLGALIDGEPKTTKQMNEAIIQAFSLTEEDITALLPSGTQTYLYNRVGWARSYLNKAGLIEVPSRGQVKITEKGREIYNSCDAITDKTLMQFPGFEEYYYGKSATEKDHKEIETMPDKKDPLETLISAYQNLNRVLADSILDHLKTMDEYVFEIKVRLLLKEMGYGEVVEDTSANKKSGDEGLDGLIKGDKLGFDLVGIQAKRFSETSTVSRPEVQNFAGALLGKGADKGVFVTTSSFTKPALEYAEATNSPKIILIDGIKLANLMIEYDLGVSTKEIYKVKEIDMDFFES